MAAESAADEAREKRLLVGELMKVMDAPGFHRGICMKMMPPGNDDARVLARVDFGSIAEASDVDVFQRTFTADELRELIAFLKTKAGQKTLTAIGEAVTASLPRMEQSVAEASGAINREDEQARLAKHPWLTTIAEIRTIATAAEAYATDHNRYPAAATMEELRTILEPTYIVKLPAKDYWGNDYLWRISPDGQHYRIISPGADHFLSFGSEILDADAQPAVSDSLEEDIIYQDGTFIRCPKEADPNSVQR